MEPALEALPARPLTAEDVATLNDASALGIIPYSWYGEQVIALLLLYDERRAGEESDPRGQEESAAEADETATASSDEGDDGDEQETGGGSEANGGFGREDSDGVGTVEVIDSGDLTPDAPEEGLAPDLGGEAADDGDEANPEEDNEQDEADALHVYAVGFDGGQDAWVAIAEIDPDAELTDAEPLFREWATRTYHDQIVDRLAVGPSEYHVEE